MKYWQYLILPLFFCYTMQSYGQNQRLLEIIESDHSLAEKQRKIDSFLLTSNRESGKADLADIYHDLGLHWNHGNWIKTGLDKYLLDAIDHTKKAVLLKSELDPLDSISLKRSLYNLGFLQKLNNELYASLKSHLRLVHLGGKDNRVKAAHQELGDTYRTLGDFQKAIDHLEMALSISQNESQNYTSEATAHIAMAENYSSMGHREYADQVKFHLQKADSLIAQETPDRNIFVRAQIAMLRGNLLLMLRDYKSALKNHLKVLEYSRSHPTEFSHTDLRHNLATVHNSIGVSYDKLGKTETAMEHLHKALHIHKEFSPSFENLGDLFLGLGEYEKGLLHYQKAIALTTDKNLEIKYNDIPLVKDLELSPEKTSLLNHLVAKANGWLEYFKDDDNPEHLNQALKTFEAADKLIDIIRFESTERQSKLHWREKSNSLYMKAVKVCHLLNKPKEAFHFMERNKALLLLEDLTHEEAKEIAGLPRDLAQREYKLRSNIFLAENKLFEADIGEPAIDSLKTSVNQRKYAYQEFIDSLNKAFPDYAKYKKKIEILSLDRMRSAYFKNREAVLHYILNESEGYGLLTTSDTTTLFPLQNVLKLNEDIHNLTKMLTNGISDINGFYNLSNTLFKKLVPGNIYDQIKGKRLTIVPDYTLQHLPFETFIVDRDPVKYLIEEMETSYVYSMSLMDHGLHNTGTIGSEELLGLAPVRFETLGLNPLGPSEKEVSEIAKVFKGELLLRKDASKENFLKRAERAKIIHLATHADIGEGENPWIAFSDEKMYLKELYATKNQSEMVVLSACNTSLGSLKRGEGVMSLARGFFYSGAKSVVSSLWPITDEAGKDIMVSFYENLNKGRSKSGALREAKLDYLRNTQVEELKHPFYWAGFIVIGDNAPLVAAKSPAWIYIGIVLLFAGGLVFVPRLLKRA